MYAMLFKFSCLRNFENMTHSLAYDKGSFIYYVTHLWGGGGPTCVTEHDVGEEKVVADSDVTIFVRLKIYLNTQFLKSHFSVNS